MRDAVTDLTRCQREILSLLAQGMAFTQITETLKVRQSTVWRHVDRMKKKLQVETTHQLVIEAYKWSVSPKTTYVPKTRAVIVHRLFE
jgi:DNA-binding NarL/FixJ family response regulator